MRTRFGRHGAAWVVGGACALGAVVTVSAQRQRAPDGPPAQVRQGAGAGTVAGRVSVPAGQRLPEMIVYLESTDPAFTFAPPAEPVVVSQRNAKFDPGMVVVPVGSRVDFRNEEQRPVEHNVFSNSEAKKFDLGLYKPKEPVAPVLFDVPGAVRVRCSIHRYMDGVVYVTPTPYFAKVGRDGRFSIGGARPGAYKLRTWQRSQRYPEADVAVTVPAGGAAEADVELSRK
jgi:plastocyanin